jgi:general secretion pathway protein L
MSKLLGIDASKTTVRTAMVRVSYRRMTLEAFGEADIAWAGSEVDAIRAAVATHGPAGPPSMPSSLGGGAQGGRPDACAIALSGEKSFYRKLELPAAAQKEIDNVLAFELEATVPFEMEEAVFDYRLLKSTSPTVVPIFAALARMEDVRGRIAPVREALGIEPERVGTGPLPLANLVSVMPELDRPANAAPIALLDIGETTSEIVILLGGEAVFARTLSVGTSSLRPQGAQPLTRELRQTFAAWRAQGGELLAGLYLVGVGAMIEGAAHFVGTELGISVLPLPRPRLEGMTEEQLANLPRFAKALGLALGLAGKGRAFNLRRGALEAERSYPFLREKIPLLSGLAAVIAVSFGFSTIAEVRALDAERETLTARLGAATRDVLGTEITEPDKAKEALESGPGKADEDPLPRVDGFDVMVQLSKAVPKDVVHDVVELDVQRGKVVVQGVVKTVGDAETIAKNMRENQCFKDVKIARTSQFTEGKQKYVLELELKCEEKKKPKSGAEPDGSAQPAGSAKPEKADGGR